MKKPIWKSKTLWINLLVMLGAIAPPVREFLVTLPGTETAAEYIAGVVAVVNMGLRFLTKEAVV